MKTLLNQKTSAVPCRYPDRPIYEAPEQWWIAKVKPRQEKQLAYYFYENGIEYYLPLCEKNSPRPGSTSQRIFYVPLFPGYISFAQNKPYNIFSSGRVVSLIEVRNQKKFIGELGNIYNLLQGNAPLTPAITTTSPDGTAVKIIHGPFTGTRGVICTHHSEGTITLSVEYLGSALLKINPSWIEPCNEEPENR